MSIAFLARNIALLCALFFMPVLSYSADFKELWREKGGTIKAVDRDAPGQPSAPETAPKVTRPASYPYEYTWDDYRKPFTELIRVPAYTHGSSSVYLDLPVEIISTRESITLYLDIESNFTLTIDGSSVKTFEGWTGYCRVNGAFLFGKHRLRVSYLPARQTTSISISTKNLKAGKNTFEFSMSPTDGRLIYGSSGSGVPIVFGIHKMWLSELMVPSQKRGIEKVKDGAGDQASDQHMSSEIERKLIELKYLLDKGLINQGDYDRKKKDLLDQL